MYSSPKYSGEPTAQALATGLATLGRYGDDYMVHASEGETIIPGEIFEANPRLKQDLFRQMTMMGIEDPNRYVVGNSLNSLNPITGQPEFFFKKIWRAAKKVLKKAAPVLAPIVGNMINCTGYRRHHCIGPDHQTYGRVVGRCAEGWCVLVCGRGFDPGSRRCVQ